MSLPYDRPSDPAKRHSAALTDGPDRAAARAMLKGMGFTDDDLAQPIIGVATTWIETMPCNLNQRRLAEFVKEGIRAAGGTPMEFNTIAVSDGVAMGTEGMKASLVSREVVADSIELVARGHLFDGLVVLSGLRQDQSRGGHGRGSPRHPQRHPLQRHDLPGHLQGRGAGRRQRLRGHRRLPRRQDQPRGALRDRVGGLPGRGRLRRPVHRQHDEHVPGVPGPLAGRPQRHPGGGPAQGRGGAPVRRAGHGPGAP